MDILPFVLWVLAGTVIAMGAQQLMLSKQLKLFLKATLAAVLYMVSLITAYLGVICFHVVIRKEDAIWVLNTLFPMPGLLHTALVLVGQIVLAELLLRLIIKWAEGSENQTRRKI